MPSRSIRTAAFIASVLHPRRPAPNCFRYLNSIHIARSLPMSDASYTPPRVWTWNKENGGRFASINRPIAGPTHEK